MNKPRFERLVEGFPAAACCRNTERFYFPKGSWRRVSKPAQSYAGNGTSPVSHLSVGHHMTLSSFKGPWWASMPTVWFPMPTAGVVNSGNCGSGHAAQEPFVESGLHPPYRW
jgi:hypothetical protein